MNRTKPADTKDARDFERLVIWISTFSIAVMAGFLGSIKQVNPVLQFQFSLVTVAAFVAGGLLTLLFLRFALRGNIKRRGLFVVAVAIVFLLGYFAFGIKNAGPESRMDVSIGTAIAVAALSFVAWLLWRVSRYFERDQQRETPE